jgi:hypothetical protein
MVRITNNERIYIISFENNTRFDVKLKIITGCSREPEGSPGKHMCVEMANSKSPDKTLASISLVEGDFSIYG